ncbi:MAG: replication initiation protein RepC [Rhizobiaceae bacterium]|nr:replication initiation protein RepC [Rhizobiaceae bacterium]
MPVISPTGLRRVSAETIAATGYARRYSEPGTKCVTRTAALNVAKLAAAAMGLKTAKLALIDQLFASSKPGDWTRPGVAPVVWPSNERLARRLGVKVSTMKHHLNGLVRAGLVAYSDGPTYQRRGRRDEEGSIVEGYGIDLSPIAVRFDELSELAERAEHNARLTKQLTYRRTVLRKDVQALIFAAKEEGLPGAWDHAQARLDVIREQRAFDIEAIEEQIAALEALQVELEEAFDTAILDRNFNTALSKFRPIQATAEPQNPESSNQSRPRANARESISQAASGGMAFETKPETISTVEQDRKRRQSVLDEDVQMISLPLVRDACPAVADFVPAAFDSWSALRDSGREIAVASGINPQVWQEAQSVLGPDIAVAALAVTVQKTEMGLVAKPGAYMRRLSQLGRDGELHISRSLFGLAQASGGLAGQGGQVTVAPAAEPRKATRAFPADGSIAYSVWADIMRQHTPKPTPDLDMVAAAFRRWAEERDIDLTSPNIERILASFCRQWKL